MFKGLRPQIGGGALVGENAIVAQRLEARDGPVQIPGLEVLPLEIATQRLRVGKSLAQLTSVLA